MKFRPILADGWLPIRKWRFKINRHCILASCWFMQSTSGDKWRCWELVVRWPWARLTRRPTRS